jgi:hypothetical protein
MISFKSMFILALMCPFMHFAQVEVKWNTEVPTNILWQEVTALGNLMVSSRGGLIGLDAETGKIVWSKRAHGI